MKPVFIPHETYQNVVMEQLQKHYFGGLLVLVNRDWPLIDKFWITDLSHITTMLQPLYSDRGPKPRDPASMLRSYLLNLWLDPNSVLLSSGR